MFNIPNENLPQTGNESDPEIPPRLRPAFDDGKTPMSAEETALTRQDLTLGPVSHFIGTNRTFSLPDLRGKVVISNVHDVVNPGGVTTNFFLETHIKRIVEKDNATFHRKDFVLERYELPRADSGEPQFPNRTMPAWQFIELAEADEPWVSEWQAAVKAVSPAMAREKLIELGAEKIRSEQHAEREAVRAYNRNPAAALAAALSQIAPKLSKASK